MLQILLWTELSVSNKMHKGTFYVKNENMYDIQGVKFRGWSLVILKIKNSLYSF